jgi:hydroxymethylglutaryl-CoA lyase
MDVKIVEVGLRDGLQNEKKIIPTHVKRTVLEKLRGAGIRHLEVTSFVHPKWIPQLADAEELLEDLPHNPGGTYSALVPNAKGLERAKQYPLDQIAIFLSSSETHNVRNIKKSIEETFPILEPVVEEALKLKKRVRGYVSTVFGCPYEGEVPVKNTVNICERLFRMGVHEISLGDTTGMANPKQVYEMCKNVLETIDRASVAVHFHRSSGIEYANILASLQAGIRVFDGAVGGLGGCPYAPGATGNIATETLVEMLSRMGIETGIDPDRITACGEYAKSLSAYSA